MKKTKYFLVSAMAVMLCFMCLMTTTFSWFTRPSDSGGTLEWINGESDLSYNAVDGKNISMTTYELSEDGKSAAQTSVTSFSNSTGVAQDHRKYYRTDITNSGDNDQSVSLYIEGLNVTQGNLHLGVNSPLKTYRSFSLASVESVPSEINKLNVYLGLYSTEVSEGKLTGDVDFIHYYNTKGLEGNAYWNDRVATGKTGSFTVSDGRWEGVAQSFDIYAMTVSSNAETMMFKSKSAYFENSKATIANNNTLIFYEYGNNHYVEIRNSEHGAEIKNFFSEATVGVGSKIELPATGHNITYKSSDLSVATVSSKGTVTGLKAGTVTITASSKGIYGDTLKAECKVTVTDSVNNSDVPIVTNYKVPAKKDGKNTTVSVYWYINNEGDEALKYTIDDVYLSL